MKPVSVSSPGAFPIDDLQEKLAPVTMGCAHPSCRTQSNRRRRSGRMESCCAFRCCPIAIKFSMTMFVTDNTYVLQQHLIAYQPSDGNKMTVALLLLSKSYANID